jgi:hypothetical protein
MSGRRNRARITLLNSDGMLRISRDVVIKKAAENEFVALSSEPSGPDDVLTIAFSTEDRRQTATVRVTGRRPVVVDGAVKYELRLKRLDDHADDRDREHLESRRK